MDLQANLPYLSIMTSSYDNTTGMPYQVHSDSATTLNDTLPAKEKFPQELRIMIASHLVPHLEDEDHERHTKLNTLRTLSLTSWNWHDATYDHFHHTIQVTPEGSCQPFGVLSRLMAQPGLVRFVKELSMTHYPLTNLLEKLKDKELMDIVDTLQVSHELKEAMKVEIDIRGIPQCILLPALCNRLEVLEIDSSMFFEIAPLLKLMILDACRNGSTVFQHLRDLALYGGKSMKLEDLTAIMKLPALHTLRTDKISFSISLVHPGYVWPLDFLRSNIRCIHLMNRHMDPEGLEFLLKTCPQLEELSVIYDAEDEEFEYGEIGDVLREHGTNLQSLELGCTKPEDMEERLRRFPGFSYLTETLGDLSSLTKLQSLSVQLRSLWGAGWKKTHIADMLPTSLRHLDLSDYNENEEPNYFSDIEYGSDDDDDDPAEELSRITEEEIVASQELRLRIDGELAALVNNPRFMHLARTTVTLTENSCELWAETALKGRECGTARAKSLSNIDSDMPRYQLRRWKVLKSVSKQVS